jgi:HK97 family phage major capsid protein
MSNETTLADLKTQLVDTHKEIESFIEKTNGEIKANGTAASESKAALEQLSVKAEDICKRIDKVEAKFEGMADMRTAGQKTLGQTFVETDEYKALAQNGQGRVVKRYQGAEYKAIVNATGSNQPLVPAERVPRIVTEPNRRLTIRDLIPVARTSSNLIEVPYENTFTDNTGPQAGNSPTDYENVTKGESDATFRLDSVPVTTYAHFLRASAQVLADAVQLSSYIDGRLRYFLKLKEETDLLTGDGASGRLRGIHRFGTVFNTATRVGDTKIDTLRKAKLELATRDYVADGIILNPTDWDEIEGTKDADGRYIYGDPSRMLQSTIWGLPIVVTNTLPSGSFVVAQFAVASTLWDREDMSVAVSTEDSTNFQTNMVTIRCEERLAHVVYLPRAIVRGTFTNSPVGG